MKELIVFKNFEEYEEWVDTESSSYDKPVMIDDGWKISIDLMTECKSWKTAVRRLTRAVMNHSKECFEWLRETITESCTNGYFEDKDGWKVSGEDNNMLRKVYGSYSWGVEETDENCWYVFLNLSGKYAGHDPRLHLKKEIV